MPFVLPLSSLRHTDLPLAGGKGANLGELIAGGFPVPPGFCITTEAYRRFVDLNGLDEVIEQATRGLSLDPAALEAASAAIRARFEAGYLPEAVDRAARGAYQDLGRPAVAVRSSATAEDLPDFSFAGQQDTYLNVTGEAALMRAVARCWGSLWTARAIGYRMRNGIPHGEVALAVVVQAMVQSEASGVLFTANPLTGRRLETTIDATLGLGEALVSGQVEPDHYVVDTLSGQILAKTLGQKAISIRAVEVGGQPGGGAEAASGGTGGTVTVAESASQTQALPDAQIVELARLGQRAAEHFGGPQDVEWAWAGGQLYLVQSRPVTSLFPLFDGVKPDEPLHVGFSFASVQGLLDPLTPMGQEFFRIMGSGMAAFFHDGVTPASQFTLLTAGERFYVNLTGLLRNPTGRRLVPNVLPIIDPITGEALLDVLDDPRLVAEVRPSSLRTRWRLARFYLPLLARVARNLLFPAWSRANGLRRFEALQQGIEQRLARARTSSEKLAAVEEVAQSLPRQLITFMVPLIGAGQAAFQPLIRMASNLPGGNSLALELSRGLPHNVTTEMDLALWSVAQRIRAVPSARERFFNAAPAELAADYRAGRLDAQAAEAIDGFMGRYGMRGPGEIDLGRPRWREEPEPLFQALANYLRIEDEQRAPDAVFAAGAERAAQAAGELAAALRHTRRGRLKAFAARQMARRVRELTGLRESPKFAAIRAMGAIRAALLEVGRDLVAPGLIERAEDVFFLRLDELKELVAVAEAAASRGAGISAAPEGTGSPSRLGVSIRPASAVRALMQGEDAVPAPGAAAASPQPVVTSTHRDWRALVAERRALYEREKRRRQLPRLLLSDGTAFYEQTARITADLPGQISGVPVSPGVVEGRARVVLDPTGAHLEPGEILVCPATDPGWTPLFLAAAGLVMEIGGMMTHGSVVAREYGIPAVVGVPQATTRIKTGMLLRVDGTGGKIFVVEEGTQAIREESHE